MDKSSGINSGDISTTRQPYNTCRFSFTTSLCNRTNEGLIEECSLIVDCSRKISSQKDYVDRDLRPLPRSIGISDANLLPWRGKEQQIHPDCRNRILDPLDRGQQQPLLIYSKPFLITGWLISSQSIFSLNRVMISLQEK